MYSTPTDTEITRPGSPGKGQVFVALLPGPGSQQIERLRGGGP